MNSGRLEQISICVRVVNHVWQASVHFLGFYQTVGSSTAMLLNVVQDVFIRLQLQMNKLRGQCYNGASNMSGRKN